MKRITHLTLSISSFALVFFLASAADAQIDVGDFTISGSAEAGPLFGKQRGKDARFEEYRDLSHTLPVLSDLELILDSKKNDYYAEFEMAKPGFEDQEYRLRVGRYGLLDLEFQWTQFPHLFSADTARTPFTRDGGGGTFTLSSKPATASAANFTSSNCGTNPLCGWVNNNSHGVDLRLLNGIGRFNLKYTPTPGWTFTGTYWSNQNDGKRAFGTLMGAFGGLANNIVELTEPISYQTHNIEIGAEYAGKGWSLGLKYNASLFHNNISTLVWDNPLNLSNADPVTGAITGPCTDAAGYSNTSTGRDANRGPCRGRLDLYPSNQAHTVTLSGAADLPLQSHFMGTVSYGWRLQNDSFLPFTINSAICPDPRTCLPSRRNLDGDVRPLMVNATLVNNAIDRLNLKAYYRLYDLSNHNKTVTMPNGIVLNDAGGFDSVGNPIEPEHFYYSKNNVGFEAGYSFTRWLTGKLGYSWERMHRASVREITNSDEHTLGPTFDIRPFSSLLLRASYKHSWRDAPDYVALEDVDLANISRKFDEAKRDRDRTSLMAQYTPFGRVMLYSAFEFTSDRYRDVILGTQNDVNYSPSVGFVYTPANWLKLFGNYNWDRYDWTMDVMDRVPVGGLNTQTPATACFPAVALSANRCWTARGRDDVHTISVGGDTDLIPNILGFRIQYGFSIGRSQVHASGDQASTTPATNYANIKNAWHEVLARMEYKMTKNFGLRFGYYFNHATEQDRGVDIMKLWMGDVDVIPSASTTTTRSIFLGDKIKGPFTAHLGFIALRVDF